MPWMPGIPHDQGAHMGQRSLNPSGVIRHRTYGAWGGDYSVGKNGVGFHFLVGKQEGQWVQFYDTSFVAYHAYGANGTSGQDQCIGIEVTGTDVDAFTDWQVRALGRIASWISASHPIPLLQFESGDLGPVLYSHGPRRPTHFRGWRDHNNVDPLDHPEFRHTDRWMQADWEKVVGSAGGKPPGPPIDWEGIKKYLTQLLEGNKVRVTYATEDHLYSVSSDNVLVQTMYKVGTLPRADFPCVLAGRPDIKWVSVDAVGTKALGGQNDIDVYGTGPNDERLHAWFTGKKWGAEAHPSKP